MKLHTVYLKDSVCIHYIRDSNPVINHGVSSVCTHWFECGMQYCKRFKNIQPCVNMHNTTTVRPLNAQQQKPSLHFFHQTCQQVRLTIGQRFFKYDY